MRLKTKYKGEGNYLIVFEGPDGRRMTRLRWVNLPRDLDRLMESFVQAGRRVIRVDFKGR